MKFEVGERVQVIANGKLTEAIYQGDCMNIFAEYTKAKITINNKIKIVDIGCICKLDEPEPVKVPKETADFIETYGSSNDRYSVLAAILKDIIDCYDPDTDDLFAVLNGYVVEEEPKYYVKIVYTAGGFLNLQTERDGSFCYRLRGASEPEGYKTKFTEKEIKAIDERLWAFAVPVEEVEASE